MRLDKKSRKGSHVSLRGATEPPNKTPICMTATVCLMTCCLSYVFCLFVVRLLLYLTMSNAGRFRAFSLYIRDINSNNLAASTHNGVYCNSLLRVKPRTVNFQRAQMQATSLQNSASGWSLQFALLFEAISCRPMHISTILWYYVYNFHELIQPLTTSKLYCEHKFYNRVFFWSAHSSQAKST